MNDQPVSLTPPPEGYADWLADLKGRVHAAQQRATLAVNRKLVLLYWHKGRDILGRQAQTGWGAKVIERLAHDLRATFPGMQGFSLRNLKSLPPELQTSIEQIERELAGDGASTEDESQ